MPMITCAECGNEASASAKVCPHCGANGKTMRRRPRPPMHLSTKISLAVLVALLAVIAVVNGSSRPAAKSVAEQKEDQWEMIRIHMAEAAVGELRGRLRDPGSLTFEKILVGEQGSPVCIKYRARNGFGGMDVAGYVMTDQDSYTSPAAYNRRCLHKKLYNYTDTLPTLMKLTG